VTSSNNISFTDVAVKIDGAGLGLSTLAKLVDVRVDAALESPAQATLRFFDEDFTIFDDVHVAKIGAAVTIAFNRQGGAVQQVFAGEVVAIGTDQSPAGLHELVLTCYDKGHRMARSSVIATYQTQGYGDIVQTIASRNGLTADVDNTINTIKFEHLTQTTDDASFLTQLCRRSGVHWRIDGTKLVLFAAKAGQPAATLKWPDDLIRFRTRYSATEFNDDVTVRGWDPTSKVAISGLATAAPGHHGSSGLHSQQTAVKSLGGSKRSTSRAVVVSQAEAEQVAKALRERSTTAEIVARGETFGDPRLVPGTFVEIDGVGTRLKGTYFITSVEHVYSTQGYITRFTTGPSGSSTLLDLVGSGGGGAGAGATLTALTPGLMIGLITNNKDPDGLHRVRVKFPAESDNEESAWARMASFASGNNQGASFMPEINAEVVVMFEGGDRRRPIVLGSLWNGKDVPPLATDKFLSGGKVVQWQVRTAGGQTLTFDETPGTESVSIMLPDGNTKLILNKDKVELWSNSKNLEVKSGQASLLLANGKDVTLQGVNVTIKAIQALKLEGLSVDIAAKTTAKLAGSVAVEVAGGGSAKFSATGVAEVSGSLVKIN
jgi:uncharacterized protein involved in type VI secretion and phage assembly